MEIGHERPFLFMCLNRSCKKIDDNAYVYMDKCVHAGICPFSSIADDFPHPPLRHVLQTSFTKTSTSDNITNSEWKTVTYTCGIFYSKSKVRTKWEPEGPPLYLRQSDGIIHLTQTFLPVSVWSLGRKAGLQSFLLQPDSSAASLRAVRSKK